MTISTQSEAVSSYTTETILAFGYPIRWWPATCAHILLGCQARYQADIRQLQAKWGCTLEVLRTRYLDVGHEDFAADDDYLQWQWYADAAEQITSQLATLARR